MGIRRLAGTSGSHRAPSALQPGGVRAGGVRAGGVRAGGVRAGGVQACLLLAMAVLAASACTGNQGQPPPAQHPVAPAQPQPAQPPAAPAQPQPAQSAPTPPAVNGVPSPPPGAYTLDCGHIIGHENVPRAPDLEVVLGVIALPTRTVLQANAHEPGRLFAKRGLVVRAGAIVDLVVPAGAPAEARIGWGNAGAEGVVVRYPGCPGDSGWVAFAGGYTVSAPACVRVLVRADGGETQVGIGVGAACPDPPAG